MEQELASAKAEVSRGAEELRELERKAAEASTSRGQKVEELEKANACVPKSADAPESTAPLPPPRRQRRHRETGTTRWSPQCLPFTPKSFSYIKLFLCDRKIFSKLL